MPRTARALSIDRDDEVDPDELGDAAWAEGVLAQRATLLHEVRRHATARPMTKPARHRLVLSDGKPNDVDRYEGCYGVEDARQAVVEARLQGLHPVHKGNHSVY